MVVFPPAKINIGLQITAKRIDGYHNLVSVFYPLVLCDVLEIVVDDSAPGGAVIFNPSGLLVEGSENNNLVLKAIRIFHAKFPLPALKVYLHKVIPMGAGMGGGSSDATHTLLVLNELMGSPFDYSALHEMALQLGSDCPFFLHTSPCLVEGRGEYLHEIDLDLRRYFLALINPGVHVATAEAFAMITPQTPEFNLSEIINLPPEEWSGKIINDFEEPMITKFPDIGKALQVLNDAGAVYSAMSGSGSTVYGIFKEQPKLPELPNKWIMHVQELGN